jgi:tRNA A37 methylthiotransferase MiaB
MRAERLRDMGKEKRRTFYRRFVNQELSVLLEGRRGKEGGLRGLSRNYVPVFLGDNDDTERGNRVNEEINVVVTGLAEKGVMGRIVEG